MINNSTYVYFIFAVVLVVWGLREAITGRTTANNASKRRGATYEYVLENIMVVIIGGIKILWGGFMGLIGVQIVQKINPSVLDTLVAVTRTAFAQSSVWHVYACLVAISFLLLMVSPVVARMFGDKRPLY